MTNALRVCAARGNFLNRVWRARALFECDACRNLSRKIFHPSFGARAINAISRLMPQKG
jgi:hypothetical protein